MSKEDLEKLYQAFNERDIETVLATLHPEVDWPNGMDGGRVMGHDEVRDYWTKQWQQINPTVTPQQFEKSEDVNTVDVKI